MPQRAADLHQQRGDDYDHVDKPATILGVNTVLTLIQELREKWDWSWPVFIVVVALFIGVLMDDRSPNCVGAVDEYGCDDAPGQYDDGPK